MSLTLPVEYYRTDSASHTIGYLYQGYTVNASENGLLIVLREEISKDSNLRMKLFFCSPDLINVVTLSHVIWVAKREKDRDYLAGMKIVGAKPEDFRRWEQFLDNLTRVKAF
jgi:hypothetical protein